MISHSKIPGRTFATLVFCLSLSLATTTVYAEENGITVIGSGTVDARPDVAVVSGSISAEAELADDAITKFEAKKRSVLDAIKELGIKMLVIEESGVSINAATLDAQAAQMAAMRGEVPPDLGPKISVSEALDIRLTGINDMEHSALMKMIASILNTGNDAGLEVGPPAMNMIDIMRGGKQASSLASFKISDTDDLERIAYERAMKDAKEAGQRLAELAGAELGKIVSVSQELSDVEPGASSSSAYVALLMGAGSSPDGNDQFTSQTFQNISITVNLRVKFEMN